MSDCKKRTVFVRAALYVQNVLFERVEDGVVAPRLDNEQNLCPLVGNDDVRLDVGTFKLLNLVNDLPNVIPRDLDLFKHKAVLEGALVAPDVGHLLI